MGSTKIIENNKPSILKKCFEVTFLIFSISKNLKRISFFITKQKYTIIIKRIKIKFQRGSATARRVIYTLALQSINTSRTGEAKNPVLRDYYLGKCESKPKLVAMGAVSHKVCNIIFAILRDNKPFEIITPQEHIKQYNAAKYSIAV